MFETARGILNFCRTWNGSFGTSGMRSLHIIFLALLLLSPNARSLAASTTLIPVKLGVTDSFAVIDAPTTERMRSVYEGALFYAIGENAKALQKCGYRFQVAVSHYDEADKYAPRDTATLLEASNTWLVIGPRRSDHILMAALGLKHTPMISMTAGSNAVHDLSPPYFTMYPRPAELIRTMLRAVKKENFGKTYGTLVDVTCGVCKDFASGLKRDGRNQVSEKFVIEVATDTPDLTELIDALTANPVDFLFVSSYAKLTGFVISTLQSRFPKLKYLGPDTWGDGSYGFTDQYKILPTVRGLAVRPGLSPQRMGDMYGVQSLERDWRGKISHPPTVAFLLVDLIRSLRSDLCQLWNEKGKRLASQEAFYEFFKSLPKDHFLLEPNISVYRLENSDFGFAYREARQ